METMKNGKAPRRGGKKREFTSVDIAILLLVAVTLFGTVFGWVYQNIVDDRERKHDGNYIVSFRVEQTHRQVIEALTAGDAVYTVSDGTLLGYLRTDLTPTAVADSATIDQVVSSGSMICSGTEEDGSLSVGGSACHLTPGDTLQIRTEREYVTVFILSIAAE